MPFGRGKSFNHRFWEEVSRPGAVWFTARTRHREQNRLDSKRRWRMEAACQRWSGKCVGVPPRSRIRKLRSNQSSWPQPTDMFFSSNYIINNVFFISKKCQHHDIHSSMIISTKTKCKAKKNTLETWMDQKENDFQTATRKKTRDTKSIGLVLLMRILDSLCTRDTELGRFHNQ